MLNLRSICVKRVCSMPAKVTVRARSFETKVSQDDGGGGIF